MNPTTTTNTTTTTTNTIKEQQQSQSKKSILDKLYDPCTVCRYESIFYNATSISSTTTSSSNTNHSEDIDKVVIVKTRRNQSHKNESSSSSLQLNQNESMCLSTIPWKIKMVGKEDYQNLNNTSNTCNTSNTSKINHQHSTLQNYPPWNYLAIRHDQNMNWAQNQLEKGVHYAKEALQQQQQQQHSTKSLLQKAEDCYKQGLDLIPHHIGLLTAYSALCINDNRLLEAKKMLGDVLLDQKNIDSHQNNGNDDDHDTAVLKDAKLYLKVVEKKLQDEMQQKVKDSNRYLTSHRSDHNSSGNAEKIALSNRSEYAYQNALMERSILLQDDDDDNVTRTTIPHTLSRLKLQHMHQDVLRVGENRTMKKYELVYSSSSSAEGSDSDGQSDDDSHEQQSYNNRRKQSDSKRRRKSSHSSRHKKKKKRRKKHHDNENSNVYSHSKKRKKEKKHGR